MKYKLLLLLLLAMPYKSYAAEGVDCSIAEFAIRQAGVIRGLDVKNAVVCKLQNKEQVEKYLRDTLSTKIPKKRIQAEGEVFKTLGFIPDDFSYFDGVIEMYLSQLGGYYDSSDDYYAMASWMPSSMQLPIAIHELTHALQDQHYNLDKLLDHEGAKSDSLQAASALIEGDATAVMLDFSRNQMGFSGLAKEENISGFMLQNLSGLMLSGTLKDTPASLQAMMIFPYISGLNFAHSLLRQNGYESIDKAFTRLPSSTEEILHPEIYLKNEKSYEEVTFKDSSIPVFEDTLGEFFIVTLLSNWLTGEKASAAASGWGGDRIALYDSSQTGSLETDNIESGNHLAWKIRWDTKKDAEEFFMAVLESYEKRFGKPSLKKEKKIIFSNKDYKSIAIELDSLETTILVSKKLASKSAT